jgi:tetratricopeptide (TPR) repeat protein
MKTIDADAIVSAVALVISIFTFVWTEHRRTADTRRIVRQQLTDVVLRIADMSVQSARSPKESEYLAPAISSAARLADALIRQLPKTFINDVDYVTLASVAFDLLEVKQYYEKAIGICNNSYYRALARRGYGSRLFGAGDYQGARSQFRAALDDLSDLTDECRGRRADLFITWASCEQEGEDPNEAIKLRNSANEEIAKIQSKFVRKWYSQNQPGEGDGGEDADGALSGEPR